MYKAIFLLLSILSGPASACSSIQALDWLLGEWISQTDTMETRETWQKQGALFVGRGETKSLSKNKVISQEELLLLSIQNEIFYIAKTQGNVYPVPFKLTKCQTQLVEFTKPDHDFPQRLVYKKLSDNELEVEVSGNERQFSLRFKRK